MDDDGLVAFLNARLGEDEVIAEAAQELASSDTELAQQAGPCVSDAVYAHIERHGPARVLREVVSWQKVLGRHKPLGDASGHLFCAWCSDDADTASLNMPWPCPDVRDIAAVWSGHPDYRAEWGP